MKFLQFYLTKILSNLGITAVPLPGGVRSMMGRVAVSNTQINGLSAHRAMDGRNGVTNGMRILI